jgi:hypothetical protein
MIDASSWIKVRVVQHAFNVTCVNFDNEVVYTYKV